MVFPLQHSLLARPFLKEKIQHAVPPLFERPIYVGTSGAAMLIVLLGWQRFDPMLYQFKIAWPFDLLPVRSLESRAYSPAFGRSANPARLVVWI